MLRSLLGLVALVAPALLLSSLQGCGEALPQDLCNWLADTNNCYARFADDVGTQCGYDFVPGNDPVASTTGSFASRDDLALCVKNEGGQVVFDPPPDLTAFPVTTVGFKLLDSYAQECASGLTSDEISYSITINPVDANDAGASGPLDDHVTGGTFSVAHPEGRDVIDVTCPGGSDAYHFNTQTVDKCSEYAGFVPRAVLDSSPGRPESPASAAMAGFIRLRVEYPPEDPDAEGAQPRVIEYFNCLIPAPPAPCQNGVRDGTESDVDCGGACPTKCAAGMSCGTAADCASNDCALNGGIWQCV
jgi:hypothetical protein